MIRILFAYLVIILLAGCAGRERAIYRPDSSAPRRGVKPYTINGERYEPLSSHVGFQESGIASWYGTDFHGKPTSSGETYDMHAMTAAHKTLPLGVFVKVRNRKNGRDTVVRINDRGPFVRGRIIDLSFAAAKEIGIVEGGTASVAIEALGFRDETGTGKVTYREPDSYTRGAFGIQVGAFAIRENAEKLAGSMRVQYGQASVREAVVAGTRIFRVQAGRYTTLQQAELVREKADDKTVRNGFVVALD